MADAAYIILTKKDITQTGKFYFVKDSLFRTKIYWNKTELKISRSMTMTSTIMSSKNSLNDSKTQSWLN